MDKDLDAALDVILGLPGQVVTIITELLSILLTPIRVVLALFEPAE